MPNILLTPQIIANEALAILTNNLVYAGLVHRDYSKEFVKVGDTITIRKPATFTANDFVTEIEEQEIQESPVTVKMNRLKDVSVKLTSKENTLDLKDFTSQVIEPAMIALAQKVDEDIALEMFYRAKATVTATKASPENLIDIAHLSKALDKKKSPRTDRHLVLSPDHLYRYAITDNLSKVSYAGSSSALREAILGKLYSLNTYMDQNNISSTAEVSGTAIGTVKVETGTNANTVKLTNLSSATATLKAGDGFVYDGKLYRLTADATGVTSAADNVAVNPKFPAGVTDPVNVQIVRNSSSVAFHRNAIAFVTRQLELPFGAAKAAIASGQDFNVRVVYGYDQKTKTDTISFDILYGLAELNGDLAARLVDGTLA